MFLPFGIQIVYMTLFFTNHKLTHAIQVIGLSVLALFSFHSLAETSTVSGTSDILTNSNRSIMLQHAPDGR